MANYYDDPFDKFKLRDSKGEVIKVEPDEKTIRDQEEAKLKASNDKPPKHNVSAAEWEAAHDKFKTHKKSYEEAKENEEAALEAKRDANAGKQASSRQRYTGLDSNSNFIIQALVKNHKDKDGEDRIGFSKAAKQALASVAVKLVDGRSPADPGEELLFKAVNDIMGKAEKDRTDLEKHVLDIVKYAQSRYDHNEAAARKSEEYKDYVEARKPVTEMEREAFEKSFKSASDKGKGFRTAESFALPSTNKHESDIWYGTRVSKEGAAQSYMSRIETDANGNKVMRVYTTTGGGINKKDAADLATDKIEGKDLGRKRKGKWYLADKVNVNDLEPGSFEFSEDGSKIKIYSEDEKDFDIRNSGGWHTKKDKRMEWALNHSPNTQDLPVYEVPMSEGMSIDDALNRINNWAESNTKTVEAKRDYSGINKVSADFAKEQYVGKDKGEFITEGMPMWKVKSVINNWKARGLDIDENGKLFDKEKEPDKVGKLDELFVQVNAGEAFKSGAPVLKKGQAGVEEQTGPNGEKRLVKVYKPDQKQTLYGKGGNITTVNYEQEKNKDTGKWEKTGKEKHTTVNTHVDNVAWDDKLREKAKKDEARQTKEMYNLGSEEKPAMSQKDEVSSTDKLLGQKSKWNNKKIKEKEKWNTQNLVKALRQQPGENNED